MKSPELQNLIKSIFSNEKSKAEFMSNPDSVLSKFNLTEQEKKAVIKTHTRLGLVTSNSSQLEEALDPTWQWLAPSP
jgi:thiamine biosynthesis lipoprotein ApbE